MDAQRAYGRVAGLMYFVVLVLDIGGVVIQSAAAGGGTFVDVSHRLATSEVLYRIGLCLGLGGALATMPLAVGLYVAVRPADGNLAMLALLFRAAEAAIGGVGSGLGFLSLQIHLAAYHPAALDANQLGALADLISRGDASTSVGAIFFCCGSTIFFYLFWKSRYIPRLMSGWGIFASIVYAAAWFFGLVLPQDSGLVLGISSAPIFVAEISTGLWLLIRSVSVRETRA